jgi:hypothetical protein
VDDDEIAFSVRVSDQPDVLDRFRVGARFEQKGVTYRVVGHAWEMSDDNDAVVTVTGRTSPPDPAAEQARVERRRAREHREANPKHLGDMGYVPYLASSRAKVLDAKARTELLRDELDGYLGRRPWRSETETDGSGRRYWQVLRFDEEPPDLRVSMAISDVVNKLRGALDNWMFHTVKERLDTDRHDRDISFPISADEIDFDRWAGGSRRRWLDEPLRTRLREQQPFTSVSKPLAWLRQLSNHDKHRLPAPVGLFARSGSFGVVDCPQEVAGNVDIDTRFPQGFVADGTRHGETTLRVPFHGLRLAHSLDLVFGADLSDEDRPAPVPVVLSSMAFTVDVLLRDLDERVSNDRSRDDCR